jgi:hypothetical protein
MLSKGSRHGVNFQQVAEKSNQAVTPAEAGVQKTVETLDSRFRGNDRKTDKKCFLSNMPVTKHGQRTTDNGQ